MAKSESFDKKSLLAGATCLAASLLFEHGRLKVFLAAAGVAFLGALIYKLIVKFKPDSLSLRVFCLVYLLQNVWFCLYIVCTEDTAVWNSFYKPDFSHSPYLSTLPSLLVMLILLAVSFILKKQMLNPSPFAVLINSSSFPKAAGTILIVLNAIVPLYFIAVKNFGAIGLSYVILFMQSGAICVPFLVGYFWKRLGIRKWFCVFLLVLSAALAFAEGSRSYIFFPFAFVAAGFLVAQPPARRLRVLAIYTALSAPLFIVVSLIGDVRGEIRETSDSLQERMELMLQRTWNQSQMYDSTWITASRGIWRMMSWTGTAVSILTPTEFAYRGYGDLIDEIKFNTQFLIFDSRGAVKRIYSDFGIGIAADYGFIVNEDATVPFGLIADAWSRDGPIGLAFYTAFLAFFFVALEHGVHVLFKNNPILEAIMLTIQVGQVFYKVDTTPMITTARYAFLTFVFWAIVLKILGHFLPKNRLRERPQSSPYLNLPSTAITNLKNSEQSL